MHKKEALPQPTAIQLLVKNNALAQPKTHGRYASKRVDDESGLIYFGRRYYAPQFGRWITPDPIGFEDGPNLYAYVHNQVICLLIRFF